RYEGLLQDFKREYPGINVVSVTGRGTELTNRIMTERRAGKFIADVYSGGTNSLFNDRRRRRGGGRAAPGSGRGRPAARRGGRVRPRRRGDRGSARAPRDAATAGPG